MTSSNTSPAHRADDRPIRLERAGTGQHVVHGVYGLVLSNGRTLHHVTLTWAAARPYIVIVSLTDMTTGDTRHWYLPRDLLSDGGRRGTLKVDHAGNITFLEATGDTGITWISLSRAWMAQYLTATETALTPQSHEADLDIEPPF